MATVTMIECDNPDCPSVGRPEWVDPKGKKRARGPYGWWEGDVDAVGCGPAVYFYACELACIGPAIERLVEKASREH
jgi:hypothetical protein